MSTQRVFSYSDANALLPKLKTMLKVANQELTDKAEILANAYVYYEKCEQEMNNIDTAKQVNDDFAGLRQCRLNFQAAIESLSQAKKEYVQIINFWFDEISHTGVILRDIKTGLLDFPANSDDFDYYLCWQLGENEITHWHMINDGFPGRKPMAVLDEYV